MKGLSFMTSKFTKPKFSLGLPARDLSPITITKTEMIVSPTTLPFSEQTTPQTSTSTFNASHIIDGIYIGDHRDSLNPQNLIDRNIKYILNVAKECVIAPDILSSTEIKTLHLYLEDTTEERLEQFFPQANLFIQEALSADCGILVHCFMGISRSTTFVLAYLIECEIMKKGSKTLNDFITFVREKRPQIMPNYNFINTLEEYEKALKEEDSYYYTDDANTIEEPKRKYFTDELEELIYVCWKQMFDLSTPNKNIIRIGMIFDDTHKFYSIFNENKVQLGLWDVLSLIKKTKKLPNIIFGENNGKEFKYVLNGCNYLLESNSKDIHFVEPQKLLCKIFHLKIENEIDCFLKQHITC